MTLPSGLRRWPERRYSRCPCAYVFQLIALLDVSEELIVFPAGQIDFHNLPNIILGLDPDRADCRLRSVMESLPKPLTTIRAASKPLGSPEAPSNSDDLFRRPPDCPGRPTFVIIIDFPLWQLLLHSFHVFFLSFSYASTIK
jgi:hypothetical protein